MQNKLSLQRLRIFSGSTLKLIAVIAMLLDHSALMLSPSLPFLTMPLLGDKITLSFLMHKIGRLAFPLYCFLISEGFFHTRNQKRYGLRLLIFALMSELPFNLLRSGRLFYIGSQNVYFTLFLGVVALFAFENINGNLKKAVVMLAAMLAARFLKVDYGMAGVALILVMYILRSHPAAQAVVAYPLLSGGTAAFCAFLPINLYNGQRGFVRSKALQYFFYLFYPVHLLLLWLLRYFL